MSADYRLQPRAARRVILDDVKLARAAVLAAAMVSPAAAGPLGDAIARHGDADVAALHQQLGDVAARCTLGAVYAKRGDLSRARLYLDSCDDAPLPEDIAPTVVRAVHD